MKKIFSSIIFILIGLIACGFTYNTYETNRQIINPEYEEYLKLSDEEKEKITIIPKEYLNVYSIKDNNLKLFKLNIYPTTYDLRNVSGKNYVPALKDQSPYSLCWTFSANTSLETYLLKQNMGSHDFSERQYDYLTANSLYAVLNNPYSPYETLYSSDYGFRRSLGTTGGNNQIVSDLWNSAVGPFYESDFAYNMQGAQKANLIFDNNKIKYDVTGTKEFDVLEIDKLKISKSFSEIKKIVNTYNEELKAHIMEYGSISTAIYMYFYDESKNLIYNDGTSAFNEYNSTGHALSIIGWDDNYGDVDGDGQGDGAWLAQNSWGEENSYIYISYYDENMLANTMGVTGAVVKDWDNSYDTVNAQRYYVYTDHQYITGNTTDINYTYEWTYFKKNNSEILKYIKIYNTNSINKKVYVTLMDEGEYIYLGEYEIDRYGIITLDVEDTEIKSNEFQISLRTENGNFKSKPKVTVLTKNINNNSSINIIPTIDAFSQYELNTTFYIRTKGIPSGTKFTVNIFDENNINIVNKFYVDQNMVINNFAYLEILKKENQDVNANSLRIKLTYGNISDEVKLNVYKFKGEGTEENPYLISDAYDLHMLGTKESVNMESLPYKYYKLTSDIDVSEFSGSSYGNIYGIYNNHGTGWIGKYFMGSLDGNGHRIINFKSHNSGLFTEIYGSKIKNLGIENASIEFLSIQNSSFGGILSNKTIYTDIENVYTDGYIMADRAGGIVGESYNSLITNSYSTAVVKSNTYSGGIVADIVYDTSGAYQKNSEISNTYYLNESNQKIGGIVGKLVYKQKAGYTDTNKLILKNNYYSKSESHIIARSISVIEGTAHIEESNDVKITESNYLLKNTYNSFDFNNIWYIEEEKTPELKVFAIPSTIEELKIPNEFDISAGFIKNFPINKTVGDLKTLLNINDNLSYKVYSMNGLEKKTGTIITGDIIQIDNGYRIKRYQVLINGDTNLDGDVDIYDIIAMRKIILFNDGESSIQIKNFASDLEKDEEIDIYDIIRVRAKILGL